MPTTLTPVPVQAEKALTWLFETVAECPHWYLAGPIVGADGEWRGEAKGWLALHGLSSIDPIQLTDGIISDPGDVPIETMRRIVLPLDTCAVIASAGVLVHFNGGSPTGTIRELTIACQFGKPIVAFGNPAYLRNNTLRAMASCCCDTLDDAIAECVRLSA